MPKKHIVPDECVDSISVYTLRLINHGQRVSYRDESGDIQGEFRVNETQIRILFGGSKVEVRILGYVDLSGTLQVFPDVEIED